jgi:hypothetical protein
LGREETGPERLQVWVVLDLVCYPGLGVERVYKVQGAEECRPPPAWRNGPAQVENLLKAGGRPQKEATRGRNGRTQVGEGAPLEEELRAGIISPSLLQHSQDELVLRQGPGY